MLLLDRKMWWETVCKQTKNKEEKIFVSMQILYIFVFILWF